MEIRNLVALNRTIMPASLFDDSDDADRYDTEVIVRAIMNGLIGSECSSGEEEKLGWNGNDFG